MAEKHGGIGLFRLGSGIQLLKGQIVIPKEARNMFGLQPGDTLVLLADKKRGIALQTTDKLNPRSLFFVDLVIGMLIPRKVENGDK